MRRQIPGLSPGIRMACHGATTMGRVSVEFELANYEDMIRARSGVLAPEKVRRATIVGVADTGATRLVLPEHVAKQLGFPADGTINLRYADQRTAKRPKVRDVWLKLVNREGTFNAVVEKKRKDALIGAIVLEDLDL